MQKRYTEGSGFTLIELLIVVAIIAILAAIAVPNFLEAQMRAKVSRAKTDLRTIDIAINAYTIDWNVPPHLAAKVGYAPGVYPGIAGDADHQITRFATYCLTNITTPVAYLTSVGQQDPFCPPYVTHDYCGVIPNDTSQPSNQRPFTYYFGNIYGDAKGWVWGGGAPAPIENAKDHWAKWFLISLGPDYIKGPDQRPGATNRYNWSNKNYSDGVAGRQYGLWAIQYYDPSNGTKSDGDILRFQGSGGGKN